MKRISFIVAAYISMMTVALSVGAATRSVTSQAALRTFKVSGTVHDQHGTAVNSIKITFMDWLGDEIGSAVTDDSGRYVIKPIKPGKYYVRIRPLGVDNRGLVIVIRVPSHNMAMDLTLRQNISAMVRAETAHLPA